MYLVVGLGNPGKQYEITRHNVGFMVIDELANEYNTTVKKVKFKSEIGEFRIGNEKVILMKPHTFMNLSGQAVKSAIDYYDIDIENVIIIFDDFDTDLGFVRIRKLGSGGSHNGMNNIIYLTEKYNIPRIRVGIGPVLGNKKAAVLKPFAKSEWEDAKLGIIKAKEAVIDIITNDIDTAMNNYNGR